MYPGLDRTEQRNALVLEANMAGCFTGAELEAYRRAYTHMLQHPQGPSMPKGWVPIPVEQWRAICQQAGIAAAAPHVLPWVEAGQPH